MKFRAIMLIAACAVALPAMPAQAGEAPSPPAPAPASHSSFSSETATVEDVIAGVDEGYRFVAYVVRWRGARVLVSDTLAGTQHSVGDSIPFTVFRHEMGGDRLLSFSITDHQPDRGSAPAQKESPASSLASGTASVDEVLSVEDDGYRFIAYVVKWHGARVALSDPLSASHHAVGDSIKFIAMRNSVADLRLLSFMTNEDRDDVAAQAKQAAAPPPSVETGVVDEVLTTVADGYRYQAYIVQWRDARVVVPDEAAAATHYQVGERIPFLARRMAMPGVVGGGVLSFELNTAADAAADASYEGSIAFADGKASVDEVLTTQVDGYRFVAYIVKWHGARIAVSDMLASTHYAVGDHIVFPVSRDKSSGELALNFELFDFGHHQPDAAKCDPPAAKANSTPIKGQAPL